jgi:hypothetical protein
MRLAVRIVVTLKARRQDCERLTNALPQELTPVEGDPSRVTFTFDDANAAETDATPSESSRNAIAAEIDRLNGLGRLRWGRVFERVELDFISMFSADGKESRSIQPASAHAHLLPEDFADLVEKLGHPRPDPPDGWEEIKALDLPAALAAASGDDEIARVLHFVDLALEHHADLDWAVAYLAVERIEEDLASRSTNGKAAGLWSESEHTRFRRTANSFGTLGTRARHGRERTDPPPRPMSDSDASWFLRRVVARWLTYRAAAIRN